MNNPFELIELRLNNIETLLLDLKHNPKQNSQDEKDHWFDLKELCIYLPDKPSKLTVYGWVHDQSIPYHKGAKKLRFLKSEIDFWLRNGKKDSSPGPAIIPEHLLKSKRVKK